MTLRSYLDQSALLLEGVENLDGDSVANVYCGFNVSKTDEEPIDQTQIFIAAKRIQERNLKNFGERGLFIAFIGGLFEILNCQNLDEISVITKVNLTKEIRKAELFMKICKAYDLNAKILTTKDLWQDQMYWDILKNLFDKGIFTRGQLINDTLEFYESKGQLMDAMKMKTLPKELVNLPLEFVKKIGNFPAPILYTPAEVSEAYYLQNKFGINTKIGQAQERVYDKYICQDFSIFRLRQPADLTSTKSKPKTVTPYIAKPKEVRLTFSDDLESIKEKLSTIPTEESVFCFDSKFGEILNPIVEKAIFAIESARSLKRSTQSGEKVIDAILNKKLTVNDLKSKLPKLIQSYILQPLAL